jgi:hypothetical protein
MRSTGYPAIQSTPVQNEPHTSPVSAKSASSPARKETQPGTLAMVFRVVRWSAYASALILLILLLHKPAPPPVVATPEAAARVEQKFQDVQQAVDQGQSATLRMSETELNSYLASHLDFSGDGADFEDRDADTGGKGSQPTTPSVEQMRSNVRDVKVQLVDDMVKAYVVFDVHGKDMTLQLQGKLGEDNGFLKFEPLSGQIGALPIPQGTLEAAVRKLMESPENRDKLKLSDDISDLKIENGEVVAEYQ